MSALTERRGFLCGLASLPLVGGGLTLIGNPTGAAVPVAADLLEGYKTGLDQESRFLTWEMANRPDVLDRLHPLVKELDRVGRWNTINSYHLCVGSCSSAPTKGSPSQRAATILAAAGCHWERRTPSPRGDTAAGFSRSPQP